jgi:GDP/UDP-N,N'-diacetylbacillosamine 2-epimerase (hydrolysing)
MRRKSKSISEISNLKFEISNRRMRRVCFVTGTRAEFGLMASTLRAIAKTPLLQLQIVVTGMHLDPRHGDGLRQIRREGWKVDAVVPWPAGDSGHLAINAGAAMAKLGATFDRLKSDIVLIVGDRVEPFAAAAAASIGGRIVAHVHGGDRALGQVDDSLRHAITKLAHVHFPATSQSAARLARLGEDRWRIHLTGSPGIDGIRNIATSRADLSNRYTLRKEGFALLLLHPTDGNADLEFARAELVLDALRQAGPQRIIAIAPNNDPGAEGILRCWQKHSAGFQYHPDLPRADFLGLLRDAAFLIGNSSSGIIEGASFGTPVIDIGDRQKGRERNENVKNVKFDQRAIRRAIAAVWNGGRPIRFPLRNVYGGGAAGTKIARKLAEISIDERLRRKLINY